MKLRDLFVRIGFDVDGKPIKKLDDGIKGLIISIGAISGAVVSTAGSLFGLAKFTANAGDHARKTAQMLGLTAEALQELQFAASIGGVSQEEMTTALRQLANSANDASLGLTTYARTYDALGISTTKANGQLKGTDQILMEVAERFSRMPDSLQKTAYANDLFGRSGARLIPMLNQGTAGVAKLRAEAVEYGKVISDQDARASEKFNDSLTRLFAVITGVRNLIGVGLIPVLTELVTDMKDWILANREIVKSVLQDWIKRTISLLKSVYSFTKSVVEEIKDLAEGFGGLEKAIKAVTIAIGAFLALKVLYSIGLITQGIYGLVAAFWALSAAEMAATASAAALPLLIGIGIAALVLVLEDIWRFFRGDKSVTGLIVNAFEKKFPRAFNFAKDALTLFKDALEGIWNIIKGFALVWGGIVNLDLGAIKAGLLEVDRVFSEAFRRIGNTIKNALLGAFDFITGTSAYKALDGFIGKIWNWFADNNLLAPHLSGENKPEPQGMVNNYFSSSPVTAPVSNHRTVNAPSNVSINAPINVQVPPNTPQSDIGPRIQAGVRDAIGELLRQNYVPSGEEW